MSRRKLGMLLSSSPANKNIRTVLSLSKRALSEQVDTYLYLIDDGVENINHPELEILKKEGLKLFLCAYSAQIRGIPVGDNVVLGGLVVLSDLIKGCDRFVTFN